MLYKSVFILILLSADISAQNWNNPENQMLTNSMNSFFSYQINLGELLIWVNFADQT